MTDEPHDTLTSIRCPVCGARAAVLLAWHAEPQAQHAEVVEYRCPTGCQPDAETVRIIIGAA